VRQPYNRTSDEKNVTQRAQEQRKNYATRQYEQLYRGAFRFLGKQSKPALKELCERVQER
jgi:hypothetical protein